MAHGLSPAPCTWPRIAPRGAPGQGRARVPPSHLHRYWSPGRLRTSGRKCLQLISTNFCAHTLHKVLEDRWAGLRNLRPGAVIHASQRSPAEWPPGQPPAETLGLEELLENKEERSLQGAASTAWAGLEAEKSKGLGWYWW